MLFRSPLAKIEHVLEVEKATTNHSSASVVMLQGILQLLVSILLNGEFFIICLTLNIYFRQHCSENIEAPLSPFEINIHIFLFYIIQYNTKGKLYFFEETKSAYALSSK